MSNKEDVTIDPEVKEDSEETVNDDKQVEDTTTEGEPKVGDTTGDTNKVTEVPIARLNKEIERRKDLETQLEEAKKATKDDPVDESEVKKLADKLAKIEEADASAKRDATIKEHIEKAIEDAPEFKNVVNMDIIRQMALNPANKDKTYPQLLEEAYGNAVTGKRTIETTTPRGGAADTKVDFKRAETDGDYRKEIFADPTLKAEYNKDIETRIGI